MFINNTHHQTETELATIQWSDEDNIVRCRLKHHNFSNFEHIEGAVQTLRAITHGRPCQLIVENVRPNHASAEVRKFLNQHVHSIVEDLIFVVPSPLRLLVEFMARLVLPSSPLNLHFVSDLHAAFQLVKQTETLKTTG